MSLIQVMREDRIAAFKAKRNIEKDVLSVVIAAACLKDKEPEDAAVLAAIKSTIEGCEVVKAKAEVGSFNEYKAIQEIEILSKYRPIQLREDELRVVIEQIVADGATKIGDVFKALGAKYPNMYDGTVAKKVTGEVLAAK